MWIELDTVNGNRVLVNMDRVTWIGRNPDNSRNASALLYNENGKAILCVTQSREQIMEMIDGKKT